MEFIVQYLVLAHAAGNEIPKGSTVLVTLSGRGDKDAAQVAERLGGLSG